MNKNEKFKKAREICVEIISRPNATNGKYRAAKLVQLEPSNLVQIKNGDIFFLESLQMQANLADKMIMEAEAEGKNTEDSNVMMELGEKINDIGTPIHR